MKRTHLLCFAVVACGIFCPVRVPAATTIIVSDSFTGTNGSSLAGRTPDGAHLNGQTWSTAGFNDTVINSAAGNPAPSAQGGFNGVVRMDISTPTAGYIKPSDFTLSLDLQMMSVVGGPSIYARGLGLGFYSGDTTREANEFFTGMTMKPDGTLVLVVNGAEQAASAPAPAGYSTSNFYNLTYSVDLLTGSITSVNFAGIDRTSTFSGAASAGDFTNATTQAVGFYTSSASTSGGPGFDNFVLSTQGAVPEPSSVLLLAGGGLSLLGVRRLRARWGRQR